MLAPLVTAALVSVMPSGAPGRSTANSRAFADDAGDVSCCTRDITTVTVANDDAGTIAFAFTASDATEGDDDDDLFVLIDADRDASTGFGADGADYDIAASVRTSSVADAYVGRWNNARSEFVALSRARVRASADGNDFHFSLDRHVLGDTDGFRFDVELVEVTSFGGLHMELAPDNGMWDFPVEIALRRLRPVVTAPAVVKAGGLFTAQLGLRVAGSRSFLASGRIACAVSAGGKPTTVVRREFFARRAVCSWRVPRGARGKTLRGTIGVFVTGQRTSFVGRTFRARIG